MLLSSFGICSDVDGTFQSSFRDMSFLAGHHVKLIALLFSHTQPLHLSARAKVDDAKHFETMKRVGIAIHG